MKRKLLNLGLLSFASILTIAGCSGVAGAERTSGAPTHVVDEDVKPEYALPEYDDDELPIEGKTYDLTGEFDFSTDDAARGEDLINAVSYIIGPSLTGVFQELFGNMFDWFVKSNYFTIDEINAIANVVQKYAGKDMSNPKDFILELAATVNVEKLVATIQNIKKTPEAWTDLKRVILSSTDSFRDPINYRKVDKFFEGHDPDIHALAEQEELVWDNFKIKGDGLSMVDAIGELFENDDIVVALRFFNHVIKSLVKYLNQYELGFAMKNLFNFSSGDEFDNLCMRYVMNNKLKCINDFGKVMQSLNLTDTTWQATINGAKEFVKAEMFELSQIEVAFTAIDDKTYSLYVDKFEEVYGAINPGGFRVFINFLGLLVNNIDQDLIDDVESHAQDPSQIDLLKIEELYNKCYGLLSSTDKELLDDQLQLFGIDFEQFNTDLDQLPEDQKSQLGPIMDLLNLNIIGPVNNYFAEVANIDDPYEGERVEGFSAPEVKDYGFQLIFKKGTEITSADLLRYLRDNDFSRTKVETQRECYSGNGGKSYAYDVPSERENFVLAPSVEDGDLVDTSEVGEGYFTAEFTAHYHFIDLYTDDRTDLPGEQRSKENVDLTFTVRLRVFYYVLPEVVDVFFDGFSSHLGIMDRWYDSRSYIIDSDGNKAYFNEFTGAITLEKDADYESKFATRTFSYNCHFYDQDEKRFIDVDEEHNKYYGDDVIVSLNRYDATELGTHYRLATLNIIKRAQSEEEQELLVRSYPIPVLYEVVEEIDYAIMDHYFDPGFGI